MAGIDKNTIVMLNGKLEDCSLTPKPIINNGVTINNDGKFGNCYDIDFEVPTSPFSIDSPNINIVSQNRSQINFNLSMYEDFTINSVNVYVNNAIKESFSSSYDNMVFNIKEDNDYIKGNNIIKIVVNFDEGKEVEYQLEHKIYVKQDTSLKVVMDKFEEISLQDFSSIDIITTTELPQQVKEGQIVLLTDIDKGRIVFDVKDLPTNLQENDIYVRYKEREDGNEKFTSLSQKTQLNFYINAIALFKNGSLENFEYIYIGRSGVWERILMPIFYIFDKGSYKNGLSFTGTSTGPKVPSISDSCLYFVGQSSSGGCVTNKKIDITNFNYLNILVHSISGQIEIGVSDNTNYMSFNAYQSFASGSHIKVDVSNLKGEYYIKATVLAPMSGSYTTKISSLYFSNK